MRTFPPSPWKEFLQELDAVVTEACKLPCIGGFAVILEYGISRLTSDIDVIDVAPPRMVEVLMKEGGKGSPLAINHKVFLDIVVVANAPYDYETRLRPMYLGAFKHLHLLVMDPYDVALTKLKRDSDKDFQDVLQLAEKIPFDLDHLKSATSKNSATTQPESPKTTIVPFIAGRKRSWKTARRSDSLIVRGNRAKVLIHCQMRFA